MRYVSYCRTSTTGQKWNSSTDEQHEFNVRYGDRNDWTLIEQVVDNQSGRTYLDRQGVSRCLELVRDGKVDAIVAWDISRTGRDDRLIERFIEDIYGYDGKLAVSYTGVVYEDAYTALDDTFWSRKASEYEWRKTKQRTDKGKVRHLESGSFLWRPILGYKTVKKPIEDGRMRINTLVVDEQGAAFVRRAVDLMVEGHNKLQTLEKLREEGFKATAEDKVTRIINNRKLYRGENFYKTYKVDGKTHKVMHNYPVFLTEEQLDGLDAYVSAPPQRYGDVKPFAGLVWCTCGDNATVKSYTYDKNNEKVYYFGCLSLNREQNNKQHGRSYVETECRYHMSHSRIRKAVLEFLDGPDVSHSLYVWAEHAFDSVDRLKAEIFGLEENLQILEKEKNQLVKGYVGATEHAALAKEISAQIENTNESIEELTLNLEGKRRALKNTELRLLLWSGGKLPTRESLRSSVDHYVIEIKEGIAQGEWERVKKHFDKMKLRIQVSLSETDLTTRRKSIQMVPMV